MKKQNHPATDRLLREPQVLLDYVGGTDPIYIGKSHPGTLTTEKDWQISKLTYDANGHVTGIAYANGTTSTDFQWNLRASYTYTYA